MDNFDEFVRAYPGVWVLIFGAANVALAWFWGTLKWFVKREFKAMEDHQKRQDRAITKVEDRLNKYDVHFAVSQQSFDDLVGKIDDHIEREETQVRKIEDIRLAVASIEGMMKRNGGKV
jgi:hypothetical protein